MIQAILAPISNLIGKVLDTDVPAAGASDQLKADIQMQLLAMDSKELEHATSIIVAEANGKSWLQRNWRPLMMVWFGILIGAHWLGFTPPNLTENTVNQMFALVKLGIGGYIGARTAEKVANTFSTSLGKRKNG